MPRWALIVALRSSIMKLMIAFFVSRVVPLFHRQRGQTRSLVLLRRCPRDPSTTNRSYADRLFLLYVEDLFHCNSIKFSWRRSRWEQYGGLVSRWSHKQSADVYANSKFYKQTVNVPRVYREVNRLASFSVALDRDCTRVFPWQQFT